MTRDGLVERNETTGEEERISQRGQDFRLGKVQPEQQSFVDRSGSGRTRRRPRP